MWSLTAFMQSSHALQLEHRLYSVSVGYWHLTLKVTTCFQLVRHDKEFFDSLIDTRLAHECWPSAVMIYKGNVSIRTIRNVWKLLIQICIRKKYKYKCTNNKDHHTVMFSLPFHWETGVRINWRMLPICSRKVWAYGPYWSIHTWTFIMSCTIGT